MLVRGDELVDLHLQRERILVLRPLDHEHHDERHHAGEGVDEELPAIGEVKDRSAHQPPDDERHRAREGGVASRPVRRGGGEALEEP